MRMDAPFAYCDVIDIVKRAPEYIGAVVLSQLNGKLLRNENEVHECKNNWR